MKKLLALLLLIPSICFAQYHPMLWEKAAMGEIGSGVTFVKLQGYNPAITTTFEDLSPESSLIAIPTAALTTPGCLSSSANDTAAGTGARTLTVTVVTTAFAEVTETVTLNGTTAVALATANVLGFNSVSVATAGSGGVNAGVIDCGIDCGGGSSCTTAYVTIGVSSTSAVRAAGAGGGMVSEVFQYIVPASHTLICRDIQLGSAFATAASAVEVVIDGSTNLGLFKRYWGQEVNNAAAPSIAPGYVVFPEKTYLKGKAAGVTGSNTGPVSLTADCLKINNTWEDTSQTIF